MKTEIWIKTAFVGLHQWLDANDEVAYLRDLHRHTFNVQVWHPVTHPDRQVEFHTFKTQVILATLMVRRLLTANPGMSCEMLGEALLQVLHEAGWKPSKIIVDEDGECGATISDIADNGARITAVSESISKPATTTLP